MRSQSQHGSVIREALQTGKVIRTDLQPTPLKSILEGNPIARSLPLGESADGDFSFGLWDCTAGRFQFSYHSDEFIHILEGLAIVSSGDTEITLGPGDVAFFPKGSIAYWTVPNYIKKLATFRSVQPGLVTRIVGKMKRVWRSV